jgi:hypothetical protein
MEPKAIISAKSQTHIVHFICGRSGNLHAPSDSSLSLSFIDDFVFPPIDVHFSTQLKF